jgi:hypothetical protein
MGNVVEFLGEHFDTRSSDRLAALHQELRPLAALSPEIGTPAEWLSTAISHLKVQSSAGVEAKMNAVTVSLAALHLVMMHLEAIEHGGEPWQGNAS